jgi:hypothetical protein
LDQQFIDLYEAISATDNKKFSAFTDYVAQRMLWSVEQMIDFRLHLFLFFLYSLVLIGVKIGP